MSRPLRPPLAPVKAKILRRFQRKLEALPEDIMKVVIQFGECLQTEFVPLFSANPRTKPPRIMPTAMA